MIIQFNKDRAYRAYEGLESYNAGYNDGVDDLKDYFLMWLEFANEYHSENIYEFLKETVKEVEY